MKDQKIISLYGKEVTPEHACYLTCELFGQSFRIETWIYERIVICDFEGFCEIDQSKLCDAEICKDCRKEKGDYLSADSLTSGELDRPWRTLHDAQNLVVDYFTKNIPHNGFHDPVIHALFHSPWTVVRPAEWCN